jgi:hypothetical protein
MRVAGLFVPPCQRLQDHDFQLCSIHLSSSTHAITSSQHGVVSEAAAQGVAAAKLCLQLLLKRAWAAWEQAAENGLSERLAWRRAGQKAARNICLRALRAWARLPACNKVSSHALSLDVKRAVCGTLRSVTDIPVAQSGRQGNILSSVCKL